MIKWVTEVEFGVWMCSIQSVVPHKEEQEERKDARGWEDEICPAKT